nr:Dihydrofolate reductase [uncultured bacterium]
MIDKRSTALKLAMIVAMSENRVIGYQNQMPWHLPADLKHFKMLTTGNPILMGRKTYLSIGKPLPNRHNLILTRDQHFTADGCDTVHSLAEARMLAEKEGAQTLFIIGGAEVYREYLSEVDILYLTIVHAQFTGDAFFPELDVADWRVVSHVEQPSDASNAYACTFLHWQRKSS